VLGISLRFCALVFFLFSGNALSCTASSLSARVVTFIAVISSAYGWVLMRALLQKGYSILFLNGLSMFSGGFLALGVSALTEKWQQGLPVTDYFSFIVTLFLLILIMNGAFYNLYGYLLTRYSATFLSFAGFTCPFFAHFFGWLFLAEPFCYELLIATGIVTLGLFLFYRAELAARSD
jgi:drug/metabolite transporter (DMT)-like permease